MVDHRPGFLRMGLDRLGGWGYRGNLGDSLYTMDRHGVQGTKV
jgi:hypothetical protein